MKKVIALALTVLMSAFLLTGCFEFKMESEVNYADSEDGVYQVQIWDITEGALDKQETKTTCKIILLANGSSVMEYEFEYDFGEYVLTDSVFMYGWYETYVNVAIISPVDEEEAVNVNLYYDGKIPD